MEASNGQVRGVVDTLVQVIGALGSNGIELLGEYSSSTGQGRGVRLREAALADPARPGRGLLSAKFPRRPEIRRSEEHTSELQSLMRTTYAVLCLKKKINTQ